MTATLQRDVWGILGGVGPLASAAFLATIYDQPEGLVEQHLPAVVLFSDPTIPDRTSTLLEGRDADLAAEVEWRADKLLGAGATKLVFCCVTLHRVVPLLRRSITDKLVSLVDVIFDAVEQGRRRHLMLCSEGTRRTALFEHHERWSATGGRIVLPDAADQRAVHDLIYDIKRHDCSDRHMDQVARLMDRYAVDSCIAGCTEIHILAKSIERRRSMRRDGFCIDPLTIVAAAMRGNARTAV